MKSKFNLWIIAMMFANVSSNEQSVNDFIEEVSSTKIIDFSGGKSSSLYYCVDSIKLSQMKSELSSSTSEQEKIKILNVFMKVRHEEKFCTKDLVQLLCGQLFEQSYLVAYYARMYLSFVDSAAFEKPAKIQVPPFNRINDFGDTAYYQNHCSTYLNRLQKELNNCECGD